MKHDEEWNKQFVRKSAAACTRAMRDNREYIYIMYMEWIYAAMILGVPNAYRARQRLQRILELRDVLH